MLGLAIVLFTLDGGWVVELGSLAVRQGCFCRSDEIGLFVDGLVDQI